LDVLEQEPQSSDSEFYTDPDIKKRVLITCHDIDQGPYIIPKLKRLIGSNIDLYIKGLKLNQIVNKSLGY